MRPTRKCEFCGKTFVPRSGMQKYCSEECQSEAKRLRKKRQQDLINPNRSLEIFFVQKVII